MNLLQQDAEVLSQGLVFRGAPPTWVILLVIAPAIIGLVVLAYRRGSSGVPMGIRWFLVTLRVLVLAVIATILMDPAMETLLVERKPTMNLLVTDVSASMAKKDEYLSSPDLAREVREAAELPAGEPLVRYERLELAQRTMARPLEDGRTLDQLADEGRLRLFSFGERLQAVDRVDGLAARGRVTQLGRTIERIFDEPEVKGTAIGSIILVTDGKNTSGPTPAEVLEVVGRRKIPVHTVGVGDPRALQDVEVASVLHSSVLLVGDTATFEVRIRQSGFDGQRFELRLLDGERVLASRGHTFGSGQDSQSFELLHRPEVEGRYSWTIEVRPLVGEHTKDNNRQNIEVTVKDAKIKVLYVETLPRYEYRKLMSFLTRAPDAFQTQCLLLEANRGFPQEATRGLPGLDRFPQTREELFAYDVILFGDVDPLANRFSGGDPNKARELMELIREFVEEGGGLAMLSGDRFMPRAYKDTPLGEVLPIQVDPAEEAFSGADRGFKVRLSELGETHPIMQIDTSETDAEWNRRIWEERGRLAYLEDHFGFARVKKAKPGAIVLARHEAERNIHGAYPIHVAGTYGEGPVFFTAVDDTWRWFKWQGPFSHHRFWGNVVRHLARTRLFQGDKRFRLLSDRSRYQIGDSVTLTAYIKDQTFQPSQEETYQVRLLAPGAAAQRENLVLRRVRPGQFQSSFIASETGEYQAWIPPEDGLGDERFSPISFRVATSDAERREPILDTLTLQTIAERTGGKSVGLGQLRDLISEVTEGSVEIPRQRRYLHFRDAESPWLPWLPVIIVSLLTVEWLVRKRFRYL